jgi:hypothetical protein
MMKKILVMTVMLIATAFYANAQTLAVLKAIDSSLLKNANAVKRFEESELIVEDIDKAVYKSKQVYTILNEKGDNFLSFYEWTDKFRKLDEVTISMLNPLGMATKVYTKKDLSKDASSSDIANDNMLYYLRLKGVSYPTHIQIEYTVKSKGLLYYPDFDIQHPDEAVEYAKFKVTVPKKIGLRHHNQFTEIEPNKEEAGENITYTWLVRNLAAFENEEGSVSWESRNPKVLIAPNQFRMDDYAGDMTSWQSFGKWFGELASKSMDLTENTKTYMRSLVANTPNPAEQVKIVYQYLQDNFRYVSIQLGIGGFKPFTASFTDTKKYGDCKALSNYMKACLDAVGIKSHLALINAGDNRAPVNADFPAYGFNHMILCVPMPADSIWLECTNNYADFNKLGNFTENRKALLITETGGVLVNTPRSKAEDNQLKSKDSIALSEDGSGGIRSTLYASGEYKFNFVHWLHNEYGTDQKNAIQYYLNFAAPTKYNIIWKDNIKDEFVETELDLQMEKIPAIKAGPKMFLPKHPYNICKPNSLPRAENRTKDYYFKHPCILSDTTVYILPENHEVANLPKKIQLSSKHVSYVSETMVDYSTGNVVCISILSFLNHIIPAADFQETKKIIGQVIEDQTQKIIISKK